ATEPSVPLDRLRPAAAAVERDEVDLAVVEPAFVVDLLDVGGQGLADRAVRGGRAAVRVRVADLDLGRRDPRPLRSSRPREEQRPERGDESESDNGPARHGALL